MKKTTSEVKIAQILGSSNANLNQYKKSSAQFSEGKNQRNFSLTHQDIAKTLSQKYKEVKRKPSYSQLSSENKSLTLSINYSKSPFQNNKHNQSSQSPFKNIVTQNFQEIKNEEFLGQKCSEETAPSSSKNSSKLQYPLQPKNSVPVASVTHKGSIESVKNSISELKELAKSYIPGSVKLEEIYRDKKFLQRLKNLKIATINSRSAVSTNNNKAVAMSSTTSPTYSKQTGFGPSHNGGIPSNANMSVNVSPENDKLGKGSVTQTYLATVNNNCGGAQSSINNTDKKSFIKKNSQPHVEINLDKNRCSGASADEGGDSNGKHRKVASMLNFFQKNIPVDKMFIDPKKGPLNMMLNSEAKKKNSKEKYKQNYRSSNHNNSANSSYNNISMNNNNNVNNFNSSSQIPAGITMGSSIPACLIEDERGIVENQRIMKIVEKHLRKGRDQGYVIESINEVLDLLINNDKTYSGSISKFKELLEQLLQNIFEKMLLMQQELTRNRNFIEINEKLLAEKSQLEESIRKLTKENQKYEQMLTTASTGYTTQDVATNSKSVKHPSSLCHAKISNESLECNIGMEEKNSNNLKNENENEKLRLWIMELQNTLIFMRDKEAKLIKLLIAVKNKGVDLDQIFREEVLNQSNANEGVQEEVEELNECKINKIKGNQTKDKKKPEKINLEKIEKLDHGMIRVLNQENCESLMFADESIINESAQSSFNYFGKPEYFDQLNEMLKTQEMKRNPTPQKSKKNIPHKDLQNRLKLNLSEIKKKNPAEDDESSSENEENVYKGGSEMEDALDDDNDEDGQLEIEDIKDGGFEEKLIFKKVYNDVAKKEKEINIQLNKNLMIKKINYPEKENNISLGKSANVKPFEAHKK